MCIFCLALLPSAVSEQDAAQSPAAVQSVLNKLHAGESCISFLHHFIVGLIHLPRLDYLGSFFSVNSLSTITFKPRSKCVPIGYVLLLLKTWVKNLLRIRFVWLLVKMLPPQYSVCNMIKFGHQGAVFIILTVISMCLVWVRWPFPVLLIY